MMAVEPSLRATLSELLRGKGKDGLHCDCGQEDCGGPEYSAAEQKRRDESGFYEDEDDHGDEWLKSIECCSHSNGGGMIGHTHIKVQQEEPKKKTLLPFNKH